MKRYFLAAIVAVLLVACKTEDSPKRSEIPIFSVIGKNYYCEIKPLSYGISQFEFHIDSTCSIGFVGLDEPNIITVISDCKFVQIDNNVSIIGQHIDSTLHISSLNDSTIMHSGVYYFSD